MSAFRVTPVFQPAIYTAEPCRLESRRYGEASESPPGFGLRQQSRAATALSMCCTSTHANSVPFERIDRAIAEVDDFVVSGESKNERDLFRIMVYSSSLGCGVMAAFLYSLKDIRRDPTLVFTSGTVVAFALGAAACWLFWNAVRYLIRRKEAARDRHK